MSNDRVETATRVFRVLRTPLTLIALLVLLVVGFRMGYGWLTAPPPPPAAAACVPTPIADDELRSEQVSVWVLNAGGQRGLAGDVTRSLRDKNFVVVTTGNYDGEDSGIPEGTLIIGAAEDNPEVQLVAESFRDPEIRADGRADRSVEVRLGEDFPGMAQDGPEAIEYTQSEICLPRIVEATE